ncbi:MAG: formyltetrahydrofolate deformylase [Calditrichaeota bacterium]|nr:MAG: formyltetrahydrofolate deformylase [Calditrichota bacterium]MBL1205778.1 formyltetrahydrofolate deformylase [Calditrichota bacterium]NOG45606.1 formyltetrahydrofolate deformylase [Calditrichota bacterium]
MTLNSNMAVLLLSCPDRSGLVSRITNFIFERGGNIIDLDEHVSEDEEMFTIRVAWKMDNFSISKEDLKEAIKPLAKEFKAEWKIHFSEPAPKVAIFVSKFDHCLHDLLWRYKAGELHCEIALIVSNHSDLEDLAAFYKIPFHLFKINKENKAEQEKAELKLLHENNIDTIVLARYMQILSDSFCREYSNRIINIHHSFLPAFIGGNPYRQAYQRGVKIIGATSHYVTEDLDEGPIIEQDVIRVSHKDSVKDMVRKGRDLERVVLARAVKAHLEKRVMVLNKRTVIFE